MLSRYRLMAAAVSATVLTGTLLATPPAPAALATGTAPSEGLSAVSAPRSDVGLPQGRAIDLAANPGAVRTIPAAYRPTFRWWWPRCELDSGQIRRDIRAMKRAGFNRAEQVLMGGYKGEAVLEQLGYLSSAVSAVDVSNCWFKPEYKASLNDALRIAKSENFELDVTMGPAWPPRGLRTRGDLAVQALVYGTAPAVGLVPFVAPLPLALPSSGANITTLDAFLGTPLDDTLVAVTAAKVVRPGKPTVLDPTTAVDISDHVELGVVTWTPPSAGVWQVTALYRRPNKGTVPDPFNPVATRTLLEDYDRTTFAGSTGQLLRDNARDLFVDSPEWAVGALSQALWTPRFIAEFTERRGYDPTPYLPAIFVPGQAGGPLIGSVNRLPADFDFPHGLGERFRHDYYRTLTELYIDGQVRPLNAYARSRGLRLGMQAAYGEPLGVLRSSTFVDRPHHETLYSGDTGAIAFGSAVSRRAMDHYREVTSAAHQSGRTSVIGTELGANTLGDHTLTIEQYKSLADRSFAAGITRVLVHGFDVADRQNVPWPGYHSFPGLFAEQWTYDSPMIGGMRGLADYWARAAVALQNGRPAMDLAVYRLDYSSYGDSGADVPFDDKAISSRGYSHDLIDPDTLIERGSVRGRRLLPDGPAYKALVIDLDARGPSTRGALGADAARKILRLAEQGLPVVFVGTDLPHGAGFASAAAEDRAVSRDVRKALALRHVVRVGTEDALPGAMARLGVRPDFSLSKPATVYPVHRRTPAGDVWFLFNDSTKRVRTSAAFRTAGHPTAIDLWDGSAKVVARYQRRGAQVRMPVDLAPGETMLVAFGPRRTATRVVSTEAQETYVRGGQLVVADSRPGRRTTRLNDGRTVVLNGKRLPSPLTLDRWRLQVAEQSPAGTTRHDLQLSKLEDWRAIPELANASGVGTYTTTFNVSAGWVRRGRGVRLAIGEAKGAIEVFVDGRRLSRRSTDGWVLPMEGLRPGRHTLRVRLGTNRINQMVYLSRTDPQPLYRLYTARQTQPYGLLGPVRVIPVAEASISLAPRNKQ